MLDAFVLALISGAIFLLAILVLSRNVSSRVNQFYALLCFLTINWSVINYSTNHVTGANAQLLTNKLSFIAGLVLIGSVWLFSVFFPVRKMAIKPQAYLTITAILSVSILTLISPGIIESTRYDAQKQLTEVVSGDIYFLYLLAILLMVIFIAKNFFIAYRLKKNDTIVRQQIIYVATGVMLSSIGVFLMTAVIPELTGNWSISKVGFASIVFFEILTAVAIVKHKLFDIRLVVARSLGYLLSISALAFVYGILAFAVIDTFVFSATTSDVTKQIAYTLLAVILAFTFQPLKKFFDKWSNRIFYRDAYDSQVLLDKLNKTLVSTIELDKLLTGVSTVIADTLKTEFCIFGIKEVQGTKQRIVGTAQKVFDKHEIQEVRSITPTLKMKTIVTDELGEEHGKLKTLLRKNDIAVLVRLTDTPNTKTEGIGYIILGAKKSGSPYSRQDITVMEIIGDELVIAIQNSLRFEEIKNFNITLQEKVDEATRQLRRTNEKLKQLDQTKDDFISMASHQLRTPLTSIKGYVSMVMEGDAGKITKQQTKLLDQAFISSQRMVYLIADLLNVSRLKTGKFIIEPKATNLAEVVEGELSQLTETAKGRDLELSYEKPKDFPALMLDETKTRQVIMNFVDNAIYYTPAGGHIKVAVKDTGEAIEFNVSDDGIGVPKSEQHHLFTKFYRAGNAKKARPDGTGLGLFMAKKVIVAQGGSIIFKTQEGKGSTFGFSFTKKPLLPESFKGVVADEKDTK